MAKPDLTVKRVQHTLKARLLRVARTRQVSPQLVCVTLSGDLADFVSASFDDHVKVFFPTSPGAQPALPTIGPSGPAFPEGQPRSPARDYTPRRIDTVARELDLEFVLHGDGPACTWAAQAAEGQFLGVAGPRGSFVVPDGFDWHLLVGDDTALPAIARRLEELGPSARATVVLEVTNAAAKIPFQTAANADIHWLLRDGAPEGSLILPALQALELPNGVGFAWAAGESSAMRAVRKHLVSDRKLDKTHTRISGYWKRGTAAVHDKIDD